MQKNNYLTFQDAIKEYIETNQIPVVNFVWHGGESLMAGI